MDLPKENKVSKCDKDCDCKNCQMLCDNDESILVSVSPRRFGLPRAPEKKAKMEIKNKNPYEIYFKASTSNMDVFRIQPNNGRIAPNSAVSVDVQFYDSAMPLRRHEEVIVFTSAKPFEHYALYKERVCPYCMEPFGFSKHHAQKRHAHTEDCLEDKKYQSHKKIDKQPKYTSKDYAESITSRYEDSDIKHKSPKQKPKTEYHHQKAEIPRQKEYAKKMHEDDKKRLRQQTTNYETKPFERSEKRMINSDEELHKRSGFNVEKTKHIVGNHELNEMCIHALVHRPSKHACECKNCVELGTDKEYRKKLKPEEQKYARRIKSEESIAEQRVHRKEKDIYVTREEKRKKDDMKEKKREAHILARILKADDSREAFSDTEISELTRRDVRTRKTHIISEEDFIKKKEKLKKKLHKRYVEESQSTTTSDREDPSDKKIAKMERRSALKIIDEKFDMLMKMSWTNLSLLMFLIFLVTGGFITCYSSEDRRDPYYFPCILDILQYFI